ncbi:beta-N-acetylglucosaminidase domain-containing protein [bacterium]|nr:beta-N-acetylglucosaminidase domain-containing protein [candidate division CSSED10-310 bacterium]
MKSMEPVALEFWAYCGAIEGFYGRPWSERQRKTLIDQLGQSGLNTYLIAPKFDPFHRWNWRSRLPADQKRRIRALCSHGRNAGVRIILAVSPGLSIQPDTIHDLVRRVDELAGMEPGGFALLMDDIPYERADAGFHCDAAASVSNRPGIAGKPLLFCPTAYSQWHLHTWPGAETYLNAIGQNLATTWDVFWTGPTIISRQISPADLQPIRDMLQRNPVIWDNISADDYAPAQTAFPGPLTGRPASMIPYTRGLLLNPSENFSVARSAIESLAHWNRSPADYLPPDGFESALSLLAPDPSARTILRLVFGYFYTPFEVSAEWNDHLEDLRRCLISTPDPAVLAMLERMSTQIRDDANLDRFGEVWIDIYPLVRTLLGDLDYMITTLRKRLTMPPPYPPLPRRDPRWSTPITDLIVDMM